jgi:hypothetical protein
MLPRAVCGDMCLGKRTNRVDVVEGLENTVGVAVEDMCLEPRVRGSVVKSTRLLDLFISPERSWQEEQEKDIVAERVTHPKSKSSTPNFEYSISSFLNALGMVDSRLSASFSLSILCIRPLRNLACTRFGAVTTFLLPFSSLGNGAYATPPERFMLARTTGGIFCGAGKSGPDDVVKWGDQPESSGVV